MRARLPVAIVVVLALASGCRGNVNVTDGAAIPQSAIMADQLNISIPNPPLFIIPTHIGFFVGVEVPYDIAFVHNYFYLYNGSIWFRASSYKGPWAAIPFESLPPLIRKQKIEVIRKYREIEYRTFLRDKTHYRGRVFRPGR